MCPGRDRNRPKHYGGRSDVAGVGSLLQFRHPTVKISIGPCKFTLFHDPNLVVRCSGHLVFDGLAPSAMANGKAMNTIFNKLSIFADVICLSLSPFAVMTCVECVPLIVVWKWCGF